MTPCKYCKNKHYEMDDLFDCYETQIEAREALLREMGIWWKCDGNPEKDEDEAICAQCGNYWNDHTQECGTRKVDALIGPGG